MLLIAAVAVAANEDWRTEPYSAPSWVEGTRIGVPADNAKYPRVLFLHSQGLDPEPRIVLPQERWITIDLADDTIWSRPLNLPRDTKAVFLHLMLVITYPHQESGPACSIWANFRAPGSLLPALHYQTFATTSLVGEGNRSTDMVIVPVVNRKFELYYWMNPSCPLPLIINGSLQAYVR